MSTSLLKHLCLAILLSACASSSRNGRDTIHEDTFNETVSGQPEIAEDKKPQSLMDLPQTPNGGFVLAPGYYEAEFKTYCLQPGTPDPRPGDAYLQGPVTGPRKDIVESVLLNSREKPGIPQRNIQLLLWSVVSGADFNKLPGVVQADALKLLTPKQVFQLRGGVVGVLKKVSYASGVLKANNDMQRLFETGASTYESFERLAVLREPSQIKRKGVNYDQWYKQKENYYTRYFPASYQKVRIQVYVPGGLLDADNKVNGDYIVFDPTGKQASPAFTNAQRLGIGAPVIDIVRVIIQVNKGNKAPAPKRMPEKKETPAPGDKNYL